MRKKSVHFPDPDFALPGERFKRKEKESRVDFINRQVQRQGEPGSLDLRQWMRYYLRKEVFSVETDHTARAKLYDLSKFLHHFETQYPEADISGWEKPITQGFFNFLENSHDFASSSIKRIYASITNFANFLIIHEVIKAKDNPVKGTKIAQQDHLPPPRGLKVEDCGKSNGFRMSHKEVFDTLVKAAELRIEKPKDPRGRPFRDIAVLFTLRYAAIRADELCDFQWESMEDNEDNGGLRFYNVHCKGRKKRTVFVPKTAADRIRAYLKSEMESAGSKEENAEKEAKYRSSPFLIQSWRNKRMCQSDLYDILQKIRKTAEAELLPHGYEIVISPHILRHERGYELRQLGKSDSFIANTLGQKGLGEVARYTRGDQSSMEDELNEAC